MIEWRHMFFGWTDVYTEPSTRCMITRHPHKHRGHYLIYIDGEHVATRDEIGFAKWTAQNIIEGRSSK
jgi:hypothetical protein